MKLTKKLKEKIDQWFDSKSPEEVLEISKKYGIKEDNRCPCEQGVAGWCHKHHIDTL